MALRHARGGSLIELLLVSTLGCTIIGAVTTLYLSLLGNSTARTKQVMLADNGRFVMQQLGEDVARAGFRQDGQQSLTFADVESVIFTQASPPMLGYTYQISTSDAEDIRHVVYKFESPRSLKICEKYATTALSIELAAQSGPLGYCYSLFHPKQIGVERFTLQSISLNSSTAQSAQIVMTLEIYLVKDPSVRYELTKQVTQRNWQ
ncbi:PilW family protein [Vibrio sp. WXL103]|uniref:PilW family protein n=1 Tax=unclassified Vibrio TaxID=2614977 RepID=UPI003EC8AAE8